MLGPLILSYMLTVKRDATLFNACWGGHAKVARMQLTNYANPNYQNHVRVHACNIPHTDGDVLILFMLGRYFISVHLKQTRIH